MSDDTERAGGDVEPRCRAVSCDCDHRPCEHSEVREPARSACYEMLKFKYGVSTAKSFMATLQGNGFGVHYLSDEGAA